VIRFGADDPAPVLMTSVSIPPRNGGLLGDQSLQSVAVQRR
jgi:hypothetical protein